MSEQLHYRVQCHALTEFGRGWRTMAAFDLEGAARVYAERCHETNSKWLAYRVTRRGKVLDQWGTP